MRPDPTPQNAVLELLPKSAVIAADTNGPVAPSFLEMKRWVTRIGFEQLEVGSSKFLNF
jgi:hypothetical protein